MSDLNQTSIVGRFTQDPIFKKTPSGKSVCSFSIAVNDGYGDKESVAFVNCECWNKTAEFVAKYLKKGNRVGISGKIKQDRWTDTDGKNRSVIKIVALNVQGLEPRIEGKSMEVQPAQEPSQFEDTNPFDDNEMPF